MKNKGVPGLKPVQDVRSMLNKASKSSSATNKRVSMKTKSGKELPESPKEMAKERAISNVKMLITKKRK